jgi:hypothetical protein
MPQMVKNTLAARGVFVSRSTACSYVSLDSSTSRSKNVGPKSNDGNATGGAQLIATE